jgi:hypothetical protein
MCRFKRYLILSFWGAFLFIPKSAFPGDCDWGGPFLENVGQANLIVRGKILAYHEKLSLSSPPTSMDVEVLETYRGMTKDSEISIFDDPMFGAFLTTFPVDTEWILALQQKPMGEMPSNTYTIPGCWDSYLKVEASVVGNLHDTENREVQQRVSLDEFRKILQGTGSLPLLTYEEGVQAGRQQCIDNPATCGITVSECSPEASYEAMTGKLHLPCVKVHEVSGRVMVYEATLDQRLPSFTFELDLKSVKAR